MSDSKTRISRLAAQAISQVDAEHPAAGQGEHVALGHEVAGEEDGQRELGELAWLNREPADDDPDLGAVHGADAGGQHGWDGQQREAERAEGIRVALQDPRLPDHREDHDEGGDSDRAPRHLVGGRRRADGADLVAGVPAAS